MKDTNDRTKQSNSEKSVKNEKINFQSLGNICLIIIAILIVGNAMLIFYMINSQEYKNTLNSVVEQTNITSNEETDTVANILNTVVSNNTPNNSLIINSIDTSVTKMMNEDWIVLYNGFILDTSKMDQVELKYIDNSNQEKDKYIITYYNYENFAFKDSTLGDFTEPINDNAIKIKNVGKIAISEDYNAIPRDVKIINTFPELVLENNTKLDVYHSVKTIIADLDGNGMEEYIIIQADRNTGYSKISLFDTTGKLVDDLAYMEKNKWDSTTNLEYYLNLENVDIIDVDNDGIMEILVHIPNYEGRDSVSLLKYKNNLLEGKTNIECSLLP